MDKLLATFVSRLVNELAYHPFITPYLNVKKAIVPFVHQHEIMALVSIRRPVRILIADEIGLGKTISAISIAKYLKKLGSANRILIIVPRILINQWTEELETLGITNVKTIERDNIASLLKPASISGCYLGSIDLLKREEYIMNISLVDWDMIIVDEAHKLSTKRARKTLRYNEIGGKLIASKPNTHSVLLSATPHKGDPEDYISRFKLLDPFLGSAKELNNRIFYRATHETLIVRRSKEDINNIYEGKEIFKPATFFAVALACRKEEKEFNIRLLEFMRTKMLFFADRNLSMDNRVIPLIRAVLFKRASSSPMAAMLTLHRMFATRTETSLNEELLEEIESLFELGFDDYEYNNEKDSDTIMDDFISSISDLLTEPDKLEIGILYKLAENIINHGDTKINSLLSLLKNIIYRNQDKIIIFTEYRDTLRYIKSKIDEKFPSWKNSVITLSSDEALNKETFRKIRKKFEDDPRCRILLATDVAAEGLNLQVANILINYEVPWSIVKLEQRMGRVWRLGQSKPVEIYTLFNDNRSDQAALNIVYRKLLNLRISELNIRPILGQEVLILETNAEEIEKIPTAIPEEDKKFKKITERTLIDTYIKGDNLELAALVRSILSAKEDMQSYLDRNSVFYRSQRKEKVDQRLNQLGFKNSAEIMLSLQRLFKGVAPMYGFIITKNDENGIRLERKSGMPRSVSQINELVDLMCTSESLSSSYTSTFVSYGPVEESVYISIIECYDKTGRRIIREIVGILENAELLRGGRLIDFVASMISSIIGVTSTKADKASLDNDRLNTAANIYADSLRHGLAPMENYLTTLVNHRLRNRMDGFVRHTDIRVKIVDTLAVISLVKKPIVPQDISQKERDKIERKAIELVLNIEKLEGRIPHKIPDSDQEMRRYDIQSYDPVSQYHRTIKVKGHTNAEICADLNEEDARVARETGDKYWLYIVYNMAKNYNVLQFQNPLLNMKYICIEKEGQEKTYILRPLQP